MSEIINTMKAAPKRNLIIRVDDELLDALRVLAHNDRRSLSACARVMLEKSIKRLGSKQTKGGRK